MEQTASFGARTQAAKAKQITNGSKGGVKWIPLIVIAFFISRGFIKTGLGSRIAYMFMSKFGKKTLGLSYSLAFTDLVLSTAMPSNTALAAGMDPIPVAVGVALSASLGFMLPVSTPPNAIVYASGYIPITKMMKTGFIIDVVGMACVTIPLVLLVVRLVVGG